ncbi:MAG TPA: hypothetical protein VE643_06775 [Nitrososphaeraceae archaeon]|nr:hypothetical protein [Nitrososphaeraceae archaeon]
MTARTTLVAYTIVIVSLAFAIAVAVDLMAANAFPTQMAYAQNVQTTPPSTSAPTFTPPGASTPTYTSPSDNSTTTNSTSGNATK